MNQPIYDEVLSLLEQYPDMLIKISLLKYELEHPARISEKQMIDTLAFARGDGNGKVPGRISNKTLYIALNYQQQTENANADTVEEIATKLMELEHKRNRLEHHVRLLDERHAKMIRLCYFELKSWEEIAETFGVAVRTAQTIRKQAVEMLVDMYAYTAELK